MSGKYKEKEEYIKGSRFTVYYEEVADPRNLGGMMISTGSIDAITPEGGFYEPLYNKQSNDLKIVKKLQNKMTELGLYKSFLYDDTPNSVFGSQLNADNFEKHLNAYDKERRINASKGKIYDYVITRDVRDKGVKALKAHKTANSKQ